MSTRTEYVCLFLVSQSRWDQHKKRTRWGFGDFSSCLFLTSLALQPLTSSELDLTLWVHWDGRDNQVAQRPHNKLPACWSCLNLSLRSQYRVLSLLSCLETYSLFPIFLASMLTNSRNFVFLPPSSSAANLHLLFAKDAHPLRDLPQHVTCYIWMSCGMGLEFWSTQF